MWDWKNNYEKGKDGYWIPQSKRGMRNDLLRQVPMLLLKVSISVSWLAAWTMLSMESQKNNYALDAANEPFPGSFQVPHLSFWG